MHVYQPIPVMCHPPKKSCYCYDLQCVQEGLELFQGQIKVSRSRADAKSQQNSKVMYKHFLIEMVRKK